MINTKINTENNTSTIDNVQPKQEEGLNNQQDQFAASSSSYTAVTTMNPCEEDMTTAESKQESCSSSNSESCSTTTEIVQESTPQLEESQQQQEEEEEEENNNNNNKQEVQLDQVEQDQSSSVAPMEEGPQSPRKKNNQKMKQLIETTRIKCQVLATRIKGIFITTTTTTTGQTKKKNGKNGSVVAQQSHTIILYSEFEQMKRNFEAKMLLLYCLATIHAVRDNEEIRQKLEKLSTESLLSLSHKMEGGNGGGVVQDLNDPNFWEQFCSNHRNSLIVSSGCTSSSALSLSQSHGQQNQENQQKQQSDTSVVFQVAEDGRIFVNIVDNTQSCA